MDIAVVTGAGKGLGYEIARALVNDGYSVLLTDIDAKAARAASAQLGGAAWSMAQDVRDAESHRAVVNEAQSRGRVRVWVNNAGVLQTGTVWQLEDETVRRHVDVNVLGVMWGCRAAVDAMRTEGGHIVNIASMSSHVPAPGLAVYGATKHAVLGFSVSLQGDLQRAGLPIHVSAVCPDAIDTDMVRNVAHTDEASVLFSASQLLTASDVASKVPALLRRPKMVMTLPPSRGALAYAMRPFPKMGLRALEVFSRLGDRRRKKTLGNAK